VNAADPTERKLPRSLEKDDRYDEIVAILSNNLRPLWRRGQYPVAQVEFTPALEKALIAAKNVQQIERGLDSIERVLASEAKGIEMVRKKTGAENPNRISRLLIFSSDGSERFYRQCESILIQHEGRVLGLRVGASAEVLGKNLFGEEKITRSLLVSDRDSVTAVLLSLLG
jgi:hypothetical protein